MATRRERIVLDVEDNATRPLLSAAGAAKVLDGALNDLDGSHIAASRSTRQLGDDTDKTSQSFKRGESSLNQFTGRLATMARAAALVGPAVVPLGAGLVPALAGMTAGLGAAASALGVTLLAANGLGDGLKALNAYQLEPSAESAAKMREEFDKLGPSGEQFVRYLDSLGPQMRGLQFLARDGLFPGVEEGIESLLQRLPQVRRIVSDIATEMGDLAGDAGAGLAGGRFDAFFEYLDKEAAPILRAFGETTGNVFESFANLLVGVDPLTQSFTDGMVRQSEALAEWSRGLADDEGFQSFINYVRESGPQALSFISQLAQSLAAIAQAAAPVGDVVLPILTGILQAVGAIAKSDLGTPIFATLAAMSALSTATKVWGSVASTSAAQFVAGQTLAAGSANKTRASLASLGKTGAVVAGIALVTAAVSSLAAANDEMEASAKRAQDAIDTGDVGTARQNIRDLEDQADALEELAHVAATSSDVGDSFMANFNPGVFANNLKDLFGESEIEEQRRKIAELRNELELLTASGGGAGQAIASLLAPGLNLSADAFANATDEGERFHNMLNGVDEALGARADWRAYQQAIDDVRRSIKDNGKTHDENTAKGRANTEALDRFAAAAVKVAGNIENVGKRVDHLDRSRDAFLRMAAGMGIGEVRAQRLADKLGLLDKQNPKPKVDLNTTTAEQREAKIRGLLKKLGLSRTDPRLGANITGFIEGDRAVLRALQELDRSKANPTVSANTGSAISNINAVTSAMGRIPRSVTTTVTTRYVSVRSANNLGPAGPDTGADGAVVPKTGLPYADRHLYLLADGERVTSNRHGQSDRFAPELDDINAGLTRQAVFNRMLVRGLADGGTAGDTGPNRVRNEAGNHLRELREALRETTRALRRVTNALEENRDQLREMKQYRAEVGSSLAGELTGGGLAQFDLGLAANRNDARTAARALQRARKKGLDGPLFDLVAASGDLALIQDFANLSAREIRQREQAYAATNRAQRNFGDLATTEKWDRSIDRQEDIVRAQAATVRRLEQRERRQSRAIEEATERGSRRGTREGARGAGRDRRRRNGSRRRNGGR